MLDQLKPTTFLGLLVVPVVLWCCSSRVRKNCHLVANLFRSWRRDLRDKRTKRTPMNVFTWIDPVIELRSADEVMILGNGTLEHRDADGRSLSAERIKWPVYLPHSALSENPELGVGVKELRIVCFAKSFQSLDIVYHDGTGFVSTGY